MAAVTRTVTPKGFRNTSRYDAWWLPPLLQFLGFGSAIAYSTWAAAQGGFYHKEPYLSPFYSPTIIIDLNFWPFVGSPLAFLGPLIHPISPAFVILIFPLGFRLTCYYYRKMYYRAFFLDPPACAVGDGAFIREESYRGETRFPFNLLNLHRYFLYAALVILVILSYDFLIAFRQPEGWGVGLGTLILGLNLATLALYTFSCHSLRHLVGGKLDCFSCSRFAEARYRGWKGISRLNKHHMLFAWVSLGAVCLADFYVRLIAGGIPGLAFEDPVFFHFELWQGLLVAGVILGYVVIRAYAGRSPGSGKESSSGA